MNRILPKSLMSHWKDPKGLIQMIVGPRQVGKTTAITNLMNPDQSVYVSADLPTPPTPEFIISHWEKARNLSTPTPTLILDEIQKIPRWSEAVKKMWDEDQRQKKKMKVWILGSSALLLEKGLSESLTGRVELNFFPHWIYKECKEAFHCSLEQYVKWGGYPRIYSLLDDEERANDYIQNSIIEPTLGRDVLSLHAVDKPALLRQLFWYISKLPSQIVSFEKILGHLQGKGNSATLVHYAELLQMAFIVLPLSKYSSKAHRTKRSQPKWILPNPALVDSTIRNIGLEGFVFENLVGSHLANLTFGSKRNSLQYWREEDQEMDFILLENNEPILAIEVKSGRIRNVPSQPYLASKGMTCPLLVIDKKNVDQFLETKEIGEVKTFPIEAVSPC